MTQMFGKLKVAGLALTFAALSLPVTATTLADALVLAYQTNPQIVAQQAALRATDESVISARSALLPTLTQTLTASRAAQLNTRSAFRDPRGQWTLNTTMTIQLFDGGADKLNIQAARMGVLAARQALLQIEQSVLFNTVQAYVDVRRDQQFVRLAQNNVRVLREQVRAAKDRFEVGEVTRTDVAQAEARLAAALSQLETSRGNLARSENSYTAVVGIKPRNLRTPPAAPKLPSTMEKAEAVAIKKHPRVMQAQFNAKAAEMTARSTFKNRTPQINGQVGYTMGTNFGGDELSTDDVTATITGTFPIYQGGRLDSNRRRDIALHQQALSNVQQSGYLTRQGLRNAWAGWKTASASIKSNREQVRAAQVAFEGVTEEAKLGARTTLDALDAEQELLSARSQLVNAIRDQYVAQYQVLTEMGLMTAEHLNLGVPIYNPDVNTRAVTKKQLGNLGEKRNKLFEKLKKRNGG
jgi:outer membrane protein